MSLCFLWVGKNEPKAQNLPDKEIDHQLHTWTSINSTFRASERWGAMADFHVRRNDFMQDPGFYFVRAGANCWIKNNMTAAVGYGHLWSAPPSRDLKAWTNEDRIYQQFLFSAKRGSAAITHRFRNEQRWFHLVENDQRNGKTRFVNRFRYLISFNFKVFRKPEAPALVLSDEIMLNFGKSVVYNTYDQNRLFAGFAKKISPSWSFDFGYMNVYQQRLSGFQYFMNHTVRLFFYYNREWKENQKAAHVHNDE